MKPLSPGLGAIPRVAWTLVRHPVQSAHFMRAFYRNAAVFLDVQIEAGVCPDCMTGEEPFCPYHEACLDRVLYEDLGYIPFNDDSDDGE